MNIPYCFLPWNIIKKGAAAFYWLSDFINKSMPEVELELKKAEMNIRARNYVAAAIFSDVVLFVFLMILTSMIFLKYQAGYALFVAFGVSAIISLFVFFQQIMYPRAIMNRKVKGIERHLLSALSTMQIQLNSGIPLYNVIVSISNEDYGGVSEQFRKAVKEINAGMHQVNVFENLASENPSIYFQRTMWQIVTAMKSGADLGNAISRIIHSLSEEQLVSVQAYGSKLNPLTMFYMLIVVIVPALAVTFFVVMSSFLALNESAMKGLFWGMYGVVFLFQLFFMSMIASKRPNLI